jgi:ppGpp synthetase/RelA/SpoT-type nucleotidyltranferase
LLEQSALKREYDRIAVLADRFGDVMKEQLDSLLRGHGLRLALEIQFRRKTWESIQLKIQRKELDIDGITEVKDVIGLRAVFVFKRDVARARGLISETFDIIDIEDKLEKLGESQFGYQSVHCQVRMPRDWLSTPTNRGFGNLEAEIQLRTVPQHSWAEASHALQYKEESDVPLPVRRAINRASALLETVDLEFERVLLDREVYLSSVDPSEDSQKLNVDLLERVLDQELPDGNKSPTEGYDELLDDLLEFGIGSVGDLRRLVRKHLEVAKRTDSERAAEALTGSDLLDVVMKDRARAGAFFAHVGLVRVALGEEFGARFRAYIREKNKVPPWKRERRVASN